MYSIQPHTCHTAQSALTHTFMSSGTAHNVQTDLFVQKQAGLKAAYINRDGVPYPGFFAQPDAEFASFEKLADALCNH